MHGSLGPGEQPNNPITVHMLNGKDKVSFGFSGMQEKDGKVTALWQPSKTKGWIKVEQIAPYEWREIPDKKVNNG